MREIPISELRAKCLALLNQVQKTKQPIRVTRFGKPIAEVVPATRFYVGWDGSDEDKIKILGDMVRPASEEND